MDGKLVIYLIAIVLSGGMILGGLFVDTYYSAMVIIIGLFVMICSLFGVGVHDD